LNLVDTLSMLIRPLGSLLYHFLVLLAVGAALGMAWGEWRDSRRGQKRRVFLAIVGLTVCRLPYIAVALAARLGWIQAAIFFPPLERFADAASIGLITWAFLAAGQRRVRAWDLLCMVTLILALGACVASVPLWSQAYLAAGATLDYNAFWQSHAWSAWQIGLLLLSMAALAWHRGEARGPLLAVLAFMLMGRVLQLLLPSGIPHVPLWERLTNLVAYPLVAVATYQHIVAGLRTRSQQSEALSQASLDQIKSMLSLFEATQQMSKSLNQSAVLSAAVEGVARALDADLCAVAFVADDDPGQMQLSAVHNPPRQGRSEPLDFPVEYHWAIQQAMRRKSLVLVEDQPDDRPPSRNSMQLKALYGLLGSTETGPLLVQPLLAEEEAIGVIIVGNARSQRAFTANEAKLCQAMAGQLVNAIQNARRYRMAQSKVEQLATEQADDRRGAQQTAAEYQEAAQRLVKMTAELEALREARNALEMRLVSDHADAEPITEQLPESRETDRQQPALDSARRDVEGAGVPARDQAVGATLEELRASVTTVVGYSDLLLSEAMGGMADAQRNFVRRIAASAERMIQVLNKLITEFGGGLLPHRPARRIEGRWVASDGRERPEPSLGEQVGHRDWPVVNINELLVAAVAASHAQPEAVSQTVTLKLADGLPALTVDPDQILHVLTCLLSNASLASPAGGRIGVASMQWPPVGTRLGHPEHRSRFVAITVQDSGRGLSDEALGQVFEWTRPPRTPPGLGESGADLARSRALVEAHGGYLWAEGGREAGMGATFTMALPVAGAAGAESGRAAEPSQSKLGCD